MKIGSDPWRSVAVVLALVLTAGRAGADPSPAKAAATAAFDKGRTLVKAGKYPEACAAFEQSEKLEAAYGTLYNLAGCYVKIGKLASAWAAFRELAQKDTNAARRDDSARQALALWSRLPRLVIAAPTHPEGLVVTLDGVDVTGLLGTDNPVDLGAHQITVTAASYAPWRTTTTVSEEARTVTVSIDLVPAPAASVERLPRDTTRERPAPRSHRRTYAVIAIAGSGAVIATGLYFGALARGGWNDAKALCGADLVCDNEADLARGSQLVDDARLRANVSTGLVVGGLVVLGIGVTLWLTSPSPGAKRVTVGPGPGLLGLDDLRTTDAPLAIDATAPDAPVGSDALPVDGSPTTLSGVVKQNDGVAIPDALVELLRASDLIVLASDTANGVGAYALVAGAPIDGLLRASEGARNDTYQYLARPVTTDTSLTVFMFTPATIASLAVAGGTTQGASSGFVLVQVRDDAGNPVQGAVVSGLPGVVRYNGAGGVPDAAMTATNADGIAFGFGVTPGSTTIDVQAATTSSRTVTVIGATSTIVPIIVQ